MCDLRWMKLSKYEELTNHSAHAVHALRQKGIWRDGYHCKIVEGNLWVSYTRAQEWADKWEPNNRSPQGASASIRAAGPRRRSPSST